MRLETGWDQLPAASCGKVSALTTQVLRELQQWAQQQPKTYPQDVCAPVAMCFAYTSPWSSVPQLLLGTKTALWVFAVDDIIDGPDADPAHVRRMTDRYMAIAAGEAPTPGDVLEEAMQQLRDDLATRPLFPALRQHWLTELQHLMTGMVFELEHGIAVAQGEPAPTVEQYLAHARSIGSAFICLSQWIDAETTELLPHLHTLLQGLGEMVIVNRLANDLGGYNREAGETAPLNVMVLQKPPGGVRQEIDKHLRQCADILQPLLEARVPAAVAIIRLAQWVSAFYAHTDFRPDPDPDPQEPASL